MTKETNSPEAIVSGIKSALLSCGAVTPENVDGLEKLFDTVVVDHIKKLVREKCEEQREICAEVYKEKCLDVSMPVIEKINSILNAQTPEI